MARIKVNYSMNQTFYVSEDSVKDIIAKAAKAVKHSEVLGSKVIMNDNNNFSVEIDAKIKSSFEKSISELTKEIEMLSMNLIDSKPTNISVNVMEVQ